MNFKNTPMKLKLLSILLLIVSNNAVAQCWTQIAAGTFHTVAIQANGTLWAWGLNDKGQLGDGTTTNKNIPTQIGTDTDWAIITAAGYNTLAVKTDGSLWSWGSNESGQIGDGNQGSGLYNLIPTQVGSDTDWVKITAGGSTFAIKSDSTLWGWGYNVNGRLGTGDMLEHYTPVQIGIDSDWADVSGGGNQTLALKSDNTLWGWGLNKNGSLAIGAVNNFVPVPTQTGNNTADWQKIEVGGCCSSKMIKTDGSLWAMGANNQGNIGDGGTVDLNVSTQVGVDTNWDTISTSLHSCGLKINGSMWCWGLNSLGQLGDGTFINKNVPIEIDNYSWLEVHTGLGHTVAIAADNSHYSWGWNNYGQLGDGTFVDRNIPIQIGNICNLSTNDFNINTNIKFFPNPTTAFVTVSYHLKENALVEISINNNLGQLLYRKNEYAIIGTNEDQIDLSTYKAGLYLLTLKTATGSVTVKIIKQ